VCFGLFIYLQSAVLRCATTQIPILSGDVDDEGT
jgi:hypothetical protein